MLCTMRLLGLALLLCVLAGGPCTAATDPKTALADHQITGAQFDAGIEDLTRSLATAKVDEKARQDLLAALAPLRRNLAE
jgi:truncated hemoglobin YjbI